VGLVHRVESARTLLVVDFSIKDKISQCLAVKHREQSRVTDGMMNRMPAQAPAVRMGGIAIEAADVSGDRHEVREKMSRSR
jgi:hypothetical protein